MVARVASTYTCDVSQHSCSMPGHSLEEQRVVVCVWGYVPLVCCICKVAAGRDYVRLLLETCCHLSAAR